VNDGPSTVTLRALEGEPLAEPSVRAMVEATAHAIAERNGVPLLDLETTSTSVRLTVGAGRLAAIGFAAELRRITTAWRRHKTGLEHLWGDPGADGDDDSQGWWKEGRSP